MQQHQSLCEEKVERGRALERLKVNSDFKLLFDDYLDGKETVRNLACLDKKGQKSAFKRLLAISEFEVYLDGITIGAENALVQLKEEVENGN
jgi:hypothetical protein